MSALLDPEGLAKSYESTWGRETVFASCQGGFLEETEKGEFSGCEDSKI